MSVSVDAYREQVLRNVTSLVNSFNSLELLKQVEYMCNELRLNQDVSGQISADLFAKLMSASEEEYKKGHYTSHEDFAREIEQW